MKKNIFTFLISLVYLSSYAQLPGEWMWIHGDSAANSAGSFGTIGVTSPANVPPPLYEACEWIDLNGNLWLYGGYDGNGWYSALWKYEPAINQWTWVKGLNISGGSAYYGTQGIPSPVNTPGPRTLGVPTWIDSSGDLWFFGGAASSSYADLWKYSIATNMWTWMSGSNIADAPGEYGVRGYPDANNYPPARYEVAASWADTSGYLWLFGGQVGGNVKNDLWRYTIATNMWTWMKGSDTANQASVYGARMVEDTANTPGARMVYTQWIDTDGNLWLFGGGEYYTTNDYYNDMWRYNPSTNNWTWMNGSDTANATGYYGVRCISDSLNVPGARFEDRTCSPGFAGSSVFYLWGGGQGISTTFPAQNDLWSYNVLTNQWTWLSGDTIINPTGSWGMLNVPNANNKPDGRRGALTWLDNSGHLYMFGGRNTSGYHNDLWRFTIDTSCNQVTNTPFYINAEPELSVFPNPVCQGRSTGAYSEINFTHSPLNYPASIIINNIDGKEVMRYRVQVGSTSEKIKLPELTKGVYVARLVGEEVEGHVKFVVE
jgi:hypothetical protein